MSVDAAQGLGAAGGVPLEEPVAGFCNIRYMVDTIVGSARDAMNFVGAEYPVIGVILMSMAALWVVCAAYRFGSKYIWRRVRLVSTRALKEYGDWALVTGATDGIGKGIAIQLAQQEMKLILVSRSEAKLAQTEMDITQALKGATVEMRSIVADFSSNSDDVYRNIFETVKDMDIGVLVNNVGVSYPHPQYYEELAPEAIDAMINVNVKSMLRMTRLVLPGMKERKRGLIVCMGSAAAELPSFPLYSAYAATKGIATSFVRSLQDEVAQFGIKVQAQTPLMVATKMSKIRRGSFFVGSVARFAAASVGDMVSAGTNAAAAVTCPLRAHCIQLAIGNALPASLYQMWAVKHFQGIRQAALKRKASKDQADKEKKTD